MLKEICPKCENTIFVSSGKRQKNVPAEWIDKIISHYDLSSSEQNEMAKAIEESKTQYKLKMQNVGIFQRRAAMAFTRSFDDMDGQLLSTKVESL